MLLLIDDIVTAFWKIIIDLVGNVFVFVNSAYKIFIALSKSNIFAASDYTAISGNIYKLLSIVMLFVLAYSILVKIVDPDSSKSGVDGKKTLQKLIISLILIVLVPTIFTFAFGLQDAIIESGVLTAVFTGNTVSTDESIKNGGNIMSVNSFNPFFISKTKDGDDLTNSSEYSTIIETDDSIGVYSCKKGDCTLGQVREYALYTGHFGFFKAFARNIYDDEVDFQWLAALVTGVFLVYVMVSFCFDMALRICKLAFFQLVAPIAIFCNVIPKMDDVFKKWLSNTTKTFLSVFTRIVVMNFGVYLVSLICNNNVIKLFSEDTGDTILNLLVKCFIIMGIVMFMRQAPKLLSDLFGLGDGDMKLGIKDKLKAGGAFTAGAAVGAGVTGLTRNVVNGIGNIRDAKGKKAKLGAFGKMLSSGAAGLTSGVTKGAWYAKGAGTPADMKSAATKAANKTVENRNKREAYKAAHPGFMGVTAGHLEDSFVKAKDWAGVSSGYENLKKEQEVYTQGMGFQKKLFDLAADNELVLAYEGQKKKAQERDINEASYVLTKGKDVNGNIIDGYLASNGKTYKTKNEAMAIDIRKKSEDIKMYDNLIKLAKLKTINEKLEKDKRYAAVAQEFEMFKKQHADVDIINNMGSIEKLSAEQSAMLDNAFNSLSFDSVQNTYDILSKGKEGEDGKVSGYSNLMYNNEQFKIENGRVTEEISRKIQEEQSKKSK